MAREYICPPLKYYYSMKTDVLFVLFVTLHVSFEYLSITSFVGFQIGKKSALNMPYVA